MTSIEVRLGLRGCTYIVVHDGLLMYQDLTKWLKDCQPEFFSEVMDVRLRVGLPSELFRQHCFNFAELYQGFSSCI